MEVKNMNAILAAILSFIIPGLGQAIEGYKMRGLILFIILIVLNGIFLYFHLDKIIQYIVLAIYRLIAGYDAYRLY